ncbi:MAG: hypothetical protein C4K58_02210 [Flavobacteriaceae bacterium]|nr:MAG: hypothetical protein C4K58_02210 [Flavobacteriaceae bacterium]
MKHISNQIYTMKNSPLLRAKSIAAIAFLTLLSSCFHLKTLGEAIVKNLPDAYDYGGTKKLFVPLPKSQNPYKFPYAEKTNFLEGKTLKIGDKAPVDIESIFEKSRCQALLIIRDGKIVYEKYFEKGGPETISHVQKRKWSTGKHQSTME